MPGKSSAAADGPPCPYCGQPLAKMPTRKTACPHCGNAVYLKYTPQNPTRRLMRADEAERVEAQWREHSARQAMELRAEGAGITREEIEAEVARTNLSVDSALRSIASRRALEGDRNAILLMQRLACPAEAQIWHLLFLEVDLARYRNSQVLTGRKIVFRSRDNMRICCLGCAALHGREITARDNVRDLVPSDCPRAPHGLGCAVQITMDFSDVGVPI